MRDLHSLAKVCQLICNASFGRLGVSSACYPLRLNLASTPLMTLNKEDEFD